MAFGDGHKDGFGRDARRGHVHAEETILVKGHDILFRGEGATTCAPAASPCRLHHEIESYDGVNGTLVAWVRVPTLKYSGYAGPLPLNTVIYMYYGDATVTCSQQNKTGVWDASYREVFDLHESGDQTDSTKNAFTAVGNGAVTTGATGRVGPAIDFAGGALGTTPARLVVSDGKLTTATSFTFEGWVYFRRYVPGGYVGFVTKGRECLNFDGSPVPQPSYCTAEPCGRRELTDTPKRCRFQSISARWNGFF